MAHRFRRLLPRVALLAGAGCASASGPAAPLRVAPGVRTYALLGGRWFEGSTFASRTMYVIGGAFASVAPERLDSVVNLEGAFVVPPFGDAHTHNLDGSRSVESVLNRYLAEGTFYVQVLTNTRTGADAVRNRFNQPGAMDVSYANGGLTSTHGHPFMAYEPRAMGLANPAEWQARDGDIRASRLRENNAYWFIDSLPDLDTKWATILAGKPDLIKIYLLDAEQFSESRTRVRLNDNGLRPALVPEIIARAHAAGLRVWAHVETAADFGIAARAGADGFAHLPGYGLRRDEDPERFRIREADARAAGRNGAVVTPTLQVSVQYAGTDSVRLGQMQDLQRSNLRVLRASGVKIAVGLDAFGRTTAPEMGAMRKLGVWNNAELLTMWAETTPRAIFPARQIGRLLPGYEASLIALACNPIDNFDCTQSIRVRMKQGRLIELPRTIPATTPRP